jgi:hypothetical protein
MEPKLEHDSPPVMTTAPPASSPGLTDDVIRLSNELRELVHDQLELVVLETRLCVNSVLTMAIIAIVTAVLLVSTWLALVGAAILGLVSIGLAPTVAMLVLAAANFLLTLLGWLMLRRRSRSLGWPATLRTLKPRATAAREGISS